MFLQCMHFTNTHIPTQPERPSKRKRVEDNDSHLEDNSEANAEMDTVSTRVRKDEINLADTLLGLLRASGRASRDEIETADTLLGLLSASGQATMMTSQLTQSTPCCNGSWSGGKIGTGQSRVHERHRVF